MGIQFKHIRVRYSECLFLLISDFITFTRSPENTAYRIGQSSPLMLSCSADSTHSNIVDWTFGTTKLTDGGTLYPNFRTTLKIEGSYDLVFLRANFLSAGRYTCTARTQTLEENKHAEVIIIAGMGADCTLTPLQRTTSLQRPPL